MEKKARWILLVFVIAASISVVNAALFVYYDVRITAQGQSPPVILLPGKNANGKDLRGTTIEVSIDSTRTSLTITVHPTYRTNLYKNITLIVNQDSANTYYLAFNITKAFGNPKITEAKLLIKTVNGLITIAVINLKQTGVQGWPINLPAGQNNKLRIDLLLVITPAATDGPNNPPFPNEEAKLQLIYSPQNVESPLIP